MSDSTIELMHMNKTSMNSQTSHIDSSLKSSTETSSPAHSESSTENIIEVRQSAVHGRGVFAMRDIPTGTRIIEYVGEKITKDEAEKRMERDIENGIVCVFELDDDYDIDGAVGGNESVYINHSCDPNCETEICEEKDGSHIWIIAMRDIKKGEELTYDYRFDKEDYEEYPCRCGSPNCRGYIYTEDEKTGDNV